MGNTRQIYTSQWNMFSVNIPYFLLQCFDELSIETWPSMIQHSLDSDPHILQTVLLMHTCIFIKYNRFKAFKQYEKEIQHRYTHTHTHTHTHVYIYIYIYIYIFYIAQLCLTNTINDTMQKCSAKVLYVQFGILFESFRSTNKINKVTFGPQQSDMLKKQNMMNSNYQ